MVKDSFCDNGLFCDGPEICDSVIGCKFGTVFNLDDGVSCIDDSCDEVGDKVVYIVNYGNCVDFFFCNGQEVCDVINDCGVGTFLVLSDGVQCIVDVCDENNDMIIYIFNYVLCDNGDFCDGNEQCVLGEGCKFGQVFGLNDSVQCTLDVCDELNDIVMYMLKDFVCDDGLYCNGVEICDAFLGCQIVLVVVDDGILCIFDECDEVSDFVTYIKDNLLCDNGQFCDGQEVCGNVGCEILLGSVLVQNDGVVCMMDFCDEVQDFVLY